MLTLALRQGAELVAQVRKQQRAKSGVRGNQVTYRLVRQLVGHYLLRRHKAAADAARHQPAAVEAVVGPVSRGDFVAVELGNVALDDDKQMGRRAANFQDRLALAKIDHIDAVANQPLLVRVQTVKRRGGKIEGIWHGVYLTPDA